MFSEMLGRTIYIALLMLACSDDLCVGGSGKVNESHGNSSQSTAC